MFSFGQYERQIESLSLSCLSQLVSRFPDLVKDALPSLVEDMFTIVSSLEIQNHSVITEALVSISRDLKRLPLEYLSRFTKAMAIFDYTFCKVRGKQGQGLGLGKTG